MWKLQNINKNRYFIKQESTSELLSILLSDLVYVWKETLVISDVISRFKDCNPEIEIAEESILNSVISLLDEDQKNITLEEKDSNIILKIEALSISKMKYHFDLSKQPEENVFREITFPLILLVNELKHCQDLLYKQLEAKDIELLEYRLEGFKITRKNVITKKFDQEMFKKEVKEEAEKRLKSGIASAPKALIEEMNEFYPTYNKVVSSFSTQMLKQGQIPEENEEVLENKVLEKTKVPPKRKYENEPNVPIKRPKVFKKRIL